MKIYNVTIVGGGNMGMCLAGIISRLERYKVTLLATNPKEFNKEIEIIDDELHIAYKSGNFIITDNIEESMKSADLIYCTYPAFLRERFIHKSGKYMKKNTILGFIPAYGGAEFYCKELINKGITIFGLQKPPYVCRTKKRGKIAGLMSRKSLLLVAAIPFDKSKFIVNLLEDMLQIKTVLLPNYMNVTLLPGNPLLHTSGSYRYLRDYNKGDTYPKQIYYYQEWDDECSNIICDLSNEMMNICKNLPIDLSGIKSIQEYYESPTPKALTEKFHTIPSFYPLTLPMIKNDNGYVPDFNSRFFIEDIPYGLCTIKALAMLIDKKTPMIDEILLWYKKQTGKEYFNENGEFGANISETAIPQLFGIDNVEKLREYYCK